MNTHTIVLTMTFVSFAACQTTNDTQECIEDRDAKIRTFSTVIEYQNNNFSFDPDDSSYRGNIVQFNTSIPIERLQKNSFISLGSKGVMKMGLRKIQVQNLDPGAFLQLSCLRELDLSHNNLTNLTNGIFDGLQQLKKLDLSFNKLQGIPANGQVFLALKDIRILNFSNNQIDSLERSSFFTLNNLEVLNLGHNRIKTLNPRIFHYLGALRKLYINNNFLEDISAETWIGLNDLMDLDLSNNYIRSFDMTYNFSFIDLRILDLSYNRLTYLNVNNLRKVLPNLSILDISDNNWFCADLDIIKQKLRNFRVTLPRPVSCSDVTITTTKRTRTTTAETTAKNKDPLCSNTKLEESIEDLKSVTVFLLVFFVLWLVVEIGTRLGVYRRFYIHFLSRNRRGSDAGETIALGSR